MGGGRRGKGLEGSRQSRRGSRREESHSKVEEEMPKERRKWSGAGRGRRRARW